MYTCTFCKNTFEREDVIIHASKPTQVFACRPCNTERAKRYRETDKGKGNIYKAVYKSIKKFQYKQQARYAVRNAILKGQITRPNTCQTCKETKKVEAHHHDYTKPLEVEWMCRRCHCLSHRK